ncbi:hypothetical protein J6590_055543 [Homalodisca vitripennis]|nr:hypothetical protein J6590_055543 [Homalodisca vitripennis]
MAPIAGKVNGDHWKRFLSYHCIPADWLSQNILVFNRALSSTLTGRPNVGNRSDVIAWRNVQSMLRIGSSNLMAYNRGGFLHSTIEGHSSELLHPMFTSCSFDGVDASAVPLRRMRIASSPPPRCADM